MEKQIAVLACVVAVTLTAVGRVKAQTLLPTLELKTVSGVVMPYANGIPYPSFEPQRRPVLNLAGEWLRERQPMNADLTLSGAADRVSRIESESGGRFRVDYDDSTWSTKVLPAPENRMLGGDWAGAAEKYEGGVWYRRQVTVPSDWQGRRIWFKCLSASYVADLWVNGTWVGTHEGGYTPFAFDVSPYIRFDGPNTLALRVHNIPWGSRVDVVPAVEGTDFFNYTGVIGDISLEALPNVNIARVQIVPLDTAGNLQMDVLVQNAGSTAAAANLQVTVYMADPHSPAYLTDPHADAIVGDVVAIKGTNSRALNVAAGEAEVLRLQLQVPQPRLWSPATPHLYVAKVSLLPTDNGTPAIDTFWTQFGIRTLATAGHQILLNGAPIFLRGIARHEEWPDSGRTATWEKIRQDLEIISSLHANYVRTAHYPNHPYTYLLTDRLGLAVMEEIPLWQFGAVHFQAQQERRIADQMWREMIFTNFNRPSILLWSTNNEGREVMYRSLYNKRLRDDRAENYPDGRLITQSAAADSPGPQDASQQFVDVAGWTMYFGIFHGSTPYTGTKDFLARAGELWPDKPILNTEYGMWAPTPGDEPQQLEVFQQTYQALAEAQTVAYDQPGEARPTGVLAGITWWTVFDWFVNHNRWTQTMGIMDMYRHRQKQTYPALREAYGAYKD